MGKQNAAKSHQNGQSMGRLPAFSPAMGSPSGLEAPDQPAHNMAPGFLQGDAGPSEGRGAPTIMGEAGDGGAVVTRQDLMSVSSDLKLYFLFYWRAAWQLLIGSSRV